MSEPGSGRAGTSPTQRQPSGVHIHTGSGLPRGPGLPTDSGHPRTSEGQTPAKGHRAGQEQANWDSSLALPQGSFRVTVPPGSQSSPCKGGWHIRHQVFGAPRWSISCLLRLPRPSASPAGLQITMQMRKGRNTSLGPMCVLGAHGSAFLLAPQGLPASKTRHPHNSLFPGFSEPRLTSPSQ